MEWGAWGGGGKPAAGPRMARGPWLHGVNTSLQPARSQRCLSRLPESTARTSTCNGNAAMPQCPRTSPTPSTAHNEDVHEQANGHTKPVLYLKTRCVHARAPAEA
eukprot:14273669-Alexandrium_andersonii.AAC.1